MQTLFELLIIFGMPIGYAALCWKQRKDLDAINERHDIGESID